MEKLIECLYRNKVPKNEGYIFTNTDDLYIPIYQVYLEITKRVTVNLNLVEEKVLELLNIGVCEIGEMANLLGIERNLLEITIADLYVKDMIYTSSDNCRLLMAGRMALLELSRSERKTEVLRDVYINLISGEVIDDISQFTIQERVYADDNKLKAIMDVDNLEFYRKHFKEINKIFDNEVLSYQDNTKSKVDELVSINKIENKFVKFIKIPICLYISESGKDIDVICRNNKQNIFFETHKQEILEQIRTHQVLKQIFKKYRSDKEYKLLKLDTDVKLEGRISKYYLSKSKQEVDLLELERYIFKNRKLAPNENDILIEYLIKKSNKIDIYLDLLDDFAWDIKFMTYLIGISSDIKYTVYFNQCRNEKAAFSKIKRSLKTLNNNYSQQSHDYYVKWNFDNRINIIGIPYIKKAIEDNYSVKIIDYYLVLDK